MVFMKVQHFFATNPVFTHAEFVKAINDKGKLSPKTIEATLRHYTQTGRLINIRKGLYTVLSVKDTPKNFVVDPFLLASKLAKNAILGYHTALQFYGRAYSLSQLFLIITTEKLRPFQFRSQTFKSVKTPCRLVLMQQEHYGVNTEERQGIPILVTSLERTLVDLMDRPDLGGGWEEVWRSLESVEYFKLDKIVEYVLLLNKATLTAKIGFYLEQHQEVLMVTESYLQTLQQHIPKQPHYMEKKTKGVFTKRWNLIVPQTIIEKTWEQIL
jgi:predicted transcriptional regulator of viral defense system